MCERKPAAVCSLHGVHHPSPFNPQLGAHACSSPVNHQPGSRQRMDCDVYRRISCIALIMFRAGKGAYRYSNDTTFAVSFLAYISCSQLIKHCHQVLASCSLPDLHRIEVQARAHLQMHHFSNYRRVLSHLDRRNSITIAAVPCIVVAA